MEFFGLGISELLIIVLLALIFIKPEQLPGIIKQIVIGIQKFRQISFNVREELNRVYHDEIEPNVDQIKDKINATKENLLKDTPLDAAIDFKKDVEDKMDELKNVYESNSMEVHQDHASTSDEDEIDSLEEHPDHESLHQEDENDALEEHPDTESLYDEDENENDALEEHPDHESLHQEDENESMGIHPNHASTSEEESKNDNQLNE